MTYFILTHDTAIILAISFADLILFIIAHSVARLFGIKLSGRHFTRPGNGCDVATPRTGGE